jgi:hypothetical protein
MPKRRIANPLLSIGSLLDTMRKLQADAEQTLRRGAGKRPAGGTAEPAGNVRAGSLLRASIERQLGEGIARLLDRLDLPSRSEIERLSRRVARLEETLGSGAKSRRRRPVPVKISNNRR